MQRLYPVVVAVERPAGRQRISIKRHIYTLAVIYINNTFFTVVMLHVYTLALAAFSSSSVAGIVDVLLNPRCNIGPTGNHQIR